MKVWVGSFLINFFIIFVLFWNNSSNHDLELVLRIIGITFVLNCMIHLSVLITKIYKEVL